MKLIPKWLWVWLRKLHLISETRYLLADRRMAEYARSVTDGGKNGR